jgi:hypothetical protein
MRPWCSPVSAGADVGSCALAYRYLAQVPSKSFALRGKHEIAAGTRSAGPSLPVKIVRKGNVLSRARLPINAMRPLREVRSDQPWLVLKHCSNAF